jgi:hypothetical protein
MRKSEMSTLELSRPAEDRHIENRQEISLASLQETIAEAVKKADPGCEAFVGVFVERTRPKSRLDPNWDIKGVKFGRADRATANATLATVVKRMQGAFLVCNED